MKEKIKRFKDLKRQLEMLYEKQQMLNRVTTGYRMIVDDIKEEINTLEKELNIPQIESEIIETEDEISHVSDEISEKKTLVRIEEANHSRKEMLIDVLKMFGKVTIYLFGVSFAIFPIVPLPIYLGIIGVSYAIAAFAGTAMIFGGKNPKKIHKLNVEIMDLCWLKERLFESKKSYTDNLERLQNDSRLIELNAKKDNFTTYFEETSELMNELNTAISKMEQYYTSLGLEIDRELCKSKESMTPDEEIDSILPDIKAILEAKEAEKQANKLSMEYIQIV